MLREAASAGRRVVLSSISPSLQIARSRAAVAFPKQATWRQMTTQSLPPTPAPGGAAGAAAGARASSSSAAASAAARPAAATAAAAAARPKAVHGVMSDRKGGKFWLKVAGGLGLASAALAGYLIQKHGSLEAALDAFRTFFAAAKEAPLGEPTVQELRSALGPSPPEGYINIIISMDGVVMKREWDNQTGWRTSIRPGLKEMMKTLTELGCMITFWSSEMPSSSVLDTVNKLTMEFRTAFSVTPLHLGSEHCFQRRLTAEELAAKQKAEAEKRAASAGAGASALPEEGLLERALAVFSGTSGSGAGKVRKEKHLEYFDRDPKSLLLVDCDLLSEALNPDNAITVKSIDEADKEAAEARAHNRTALPDTTTQAIVLLVKRIREDFQSSGGQLDIPRTLRVLRAEAAGQGFGSDAASLYAFLLHRAEEAKELERQRLETGLGGLARRTINSSSMLKGKLSVSDSAVTKGFKDPGAEAGENSILTAKVRNTIAKMEASMGRG